MILPLELDTFRAFKRDGAIPMNARRDLYRIQCTAASAAAYLPQG